MYKITITKEEKHPTAYTDHTDQSGVPELRVMGQTTLSVKVFEQVFEELDVSAVVLTINSNHGKETKVN